MRHKNVIYTAATLVCCVLSASTSPIHAQPLFSADFEGDLSVWVGKDGGPHNGQIVTDPLDGSNSVLNFTAVNGAGDIFSPEVVVIPGLTYTLSFDYLGYPDTGDDLGGFIGYSLGTPGDHHWLAGTHQSYPGILAHLIDDGTWHTYSIDFVPVVSPIRVMLEDYSGSDSVVGNAYFDNIELSVVLPIADADGPYLVAMGETITLDGSGSYDPDGDTLTYHWQEIEDLGDFDDDTLMNPSFTGVQVGVTELELHVSDGISNTLDRTVLVVYDPDGSFVTGGGRIDSAAGAYKPEETLAGEASFGFVSKYQKGATRPTGNTEFQFRTAELNFHSSSYEWLVVTQGGTNAQFKGSGAINGEGDYKFMLWAGDDAPDTFRIRVWEEDEFGVETVVYDNGVQQAISGGSIVVHTK